MRALMPPGVRSSRSHVPLVPSNHQSHLPKKSRPAYPPNMKKNKWCLSCFLFLNNAPNKKEIGEVLAEIRLKYQMIDYIPSSDGDVGTQNFVDFVISFNKTVVRLYDLFGVLLGLLEKAKKSPGVNRGYLKQIIALECSAENFRDNITDYVNWAIESHNANYSGNKAGKFKEGLPIVWRPRWQDEKYNHVAKSPHPAESHHPLP